jgi:hypothetical protein
VMTETAAAATTTSRTLKTPMIAIPSRGGTPDRHRLP